MQFKSSVFFEESSLQRSAGGQQEEERPVEDQEYLHKAFLHRITQHNPRVVTRRYFAQRGTSLLEFQDEKMAQATSSLDLRYSILTVGSKPRLSAPASSNGQKSSAPKHGFQITNHDQRWILHAENEFMFKQWIHNLNKACIRTDFDERFRPISRIRTSSAKDADIIECKDLSTGRVHAAKAYNKCKIVSDGGFREAVWTEIQQMRRFKHANLLKTYEVHETDHFVYVVTEFVKGGRLSDALQKGKLVTEDELKHLLRGLLRGVQALHSLGYTHRGLTAASVYLRKIDNFQTGDVVIGGARNISRALPGDFLAPDGQATNELFTTADCDSKAFPDSKEANLLESLDESGKCLEPTPLNLSRHVSGRENQSALNQSPSVGRDKRAQAARADLRSIGAIAMELVKGRSPQGGECFEELLLRNCLSQSASSRKSSAHEAQCPARAHGEPARETAERRGPPFSAPLVAFIGGFAGAKSTPDKLLEAELLDLSAELQMQDKVFDFDNSNDLDEFSPGQLLSKKQSIDISAKSISMNRSPFSAGGPSIAIRSLGSSKRVPVYLPRDLSISQDLSQEETQSKHFCSVQNRLPGNFSSGGSEQSCEDRRRSASRFSSQKVETCPKVIPKSGFFNLKPTLTKQSSFASLGGESVKKMGPKLSIDSMKKISIHK